MVALLTTSDGARRVPSHLELPLRPARPVLELVDALDAVRRAPSILRAMRAAHTVTAVAGPGIGHAHPTSVLDILQDAIEDDHDSVTGIAAIHALGRVPGRRAAMRLATLLDEGEHGADAHAAWSAMGRAPARELMRPLVSAISRAGVAGMHAQRIIGSWALTERDAILVVLAAALVDAVGVGRRTLTETNGLVPGPEATKALVGIATDESEESSIRRTAILAFSERTDERLPAALLPVLRRTDELGEAARSVSATRALTRRAARTVLQYRGGIHVAQVHLGSVIDDQMTRAGMGDTGGIATLLSRLGGALAATTRVDAVTTVTRAGNRGPARSSRQDTVARFESVRLDDTDAATFMSEWPSLIASERGIQRVFLAGRRPDVVHLRMADPGTLAAATVAQRLRIPVVFTLAPDPHGPIENGERAGRLTRAGFAAEDARTHLWFRATLVERLASAADHIALFPRAELPHQLKELLGIDITQGRPRFTVVPEGIDMDRAVAAEQTVRAAEDAARSRVAPSLSELVNRIATLPEDRHGLPIVVSVGRMHEMKGMARIVKSFGEDGGPGEHANLVLVGGDLDEPSASESNELARIHAAFERHLGLADRVVLLGHRPHGEVAQVLAVARHGHGDVIAAGGAYVCGSVKEEFGLAIVEALAAGLPVTAPRSGGPSSYVDEGITGTLVDTLDVTRIAAGITATLRLSRDPATAGAARSLVEGHYTVSRMAARLAAIYRLAAAPRGLGQPVTTTAPR